MIEEIRETGDPLRKDSIVKPCRHLKTHGSQSQWHIHGYINHSLNSADKREMNNAGEIGEQIEYIEKDHELSS